MKFKNIKLKAHITVFITLVLIIISGLLFTLIHSVIYTSLQFSFNMACRMALEGTFAGFNNEVFEKYGIYILKDDGSEDVIKRIIRDNISESSLDFLELNTTKDIYITDNNGEHFYNQTLDYMSHEGIGEEIEKYAGMLKSDDNKQKTDFNSDMEKLNELIDVDMSESEMREKLKELKAGGGINSGSLGADIDSKMNNLDKGGQESETNVELPRVPRNLYDKMKSTGGNSVDEILKTEHISDKNINDISFASYASDSNASQEDENESKTFVNNEIFREYLTLKFSSFTEQKEENELLDYQLEYILIGKKSDKENIEGVTKRLKLIREGINVAYIFSGSKMRSKAKALASELFGWTGNAILVEIAEYGIILLWGYAESIADVKALLNGDKTPLVKSESTWHVSIVDLVSLNYEPDKEKCNMGIKYNEYLRILLSMDSVDTQVLRAMDIIELHMIGKGESEFKMSEYIFEKNITAKCNLPYGRKEYIVDAEYAYSNRV